VTASQIAACAAGQLLSTCALPSADARALLAHVLGVRREHLIAFPERAVEPDAAARFAALATRLRDGEPLAYLLGSREFYGRVFGVTPDVLIPRPETELLVDSARALLREAPAPRVLDLGTGSGCIAITLALECPHAQLTAVDASARALAVARANAAALRAQVEFVTGDWYEPLSGCFDLIVANPPYIAATDPHLAALKCEPIQALTAGDDGLRCLQTIARQAPAFLRPGAHLLVEHGHDQGEAVRRLFAEAGLLKIRSLRDAAGIERVCHGRMPAAGFQDVAAGRT